MQRQCSDTADACTRADRGTREDGDAPGMFRHRGHWSSAPPVSIADSRTIGAYISGRRAGALPDAELRQRLKAVLKPAVDARYQIRGKTRQQRYAEVLRAQDVADLAVCDRSRMVRFMDGGNELRPSELQRLSQVVLRIEAGLIVRRNGVILRLAEPERLSNPPIRRAVTFDKHGRPKVVPCPPREVKPLMSAMMKDWKL